MNKTVVFTGGKAGPADISRHWVEGADLIIAADSGLELCRQWGFEPDLLCGDFDSISDTALVDDFPAEKVIRHQEAKAWSDTELALHEAAERKDNGTGSSNGTGSAPVIVLAGGNGGRTDHLFSLLQLYRHDTYPTIWLGDEQAIICLEGSRTQATVRTADTAVTLKVSGLKPDDRISCFAIPVEGGEPGGNTNAWEGDGGRATFQNQESGSSTECASSTEGASTAGGASTAPYVQLKDYRITSDTLLWPLQDVQWETGAESLSNWLAPGADRLTLQATAGRFLVFVPLHAQVQYQVV